ncbi:MAG: FRG domain-containing protein [Dysgonamonadaceae bacterium]|nr:FRG domain-containing protein [Dysgonamonadaceae bacterium]
MGKREISNLDLKVQFTNEYLRSGGLEKILDPNLLQDLINMKFDHNGKAIPESVTPRANAFMFALLGTQLQPPFYSKDFISEYSSILQKSKCFDQINIDTVEHFDKIYDEYKVKDHMLFRGQREARWRLYSNLQRFWILHKLYEEENSFEDFLDKLVTNGKTDYEEHIKQILSEHNIDTLNAISILGFLQHHSCPTPLLDWTYKFQNALFFGLDGLELNQGAKEIDDYFSLFYIEEEYMGEGGMRKLMDGSFEDVGQALTLELIAKIAKDDKQRLEMEEHFKGRSIIDKSKVFGSGLIKYVTEIKHMVNIPLSFFSDKDADSGFIFSLNNSKNIQNQVGAFTWNADPIKPLEIIGNEQYLLAKEESKPEEYRFCSCFNINKKLEDHILKRLEDDGITRDFIYPTPDINTWDIYEKSRTKASR